MCANALDEKSHAEQDFIYCMKADEASHKDRNCEEKGNPSRNTETHSRTNSASRAIGFRSKGNTDWLDRGGRSGVRAALQLHHVVNDLLVTPNCTRHKRDQYAI